MIHAHEQLEAQQSVLPRGRLLVERRGPVGLCVLCSQDLPRPVASSQDEQKEPAAHGGRPRVATEVPRSAGDRDFGSDHADLEESIVSVVARKIP